ncbi:MAG: hypothetical protein KDD29_06305 [Flavobacteriales bacterium]|nr:hypothetical protein [Flavobacteriales bacterium]MCB9335144.1 hypothetical protein [Flavobacteriales bacterium]
MSLFNSHNSDNIEIRPRFKLVSKFSKDEIITKIKTELPNQDEVKATIKGNHIFLTIIDKNQHYWSPVMEVVVEKYRANKNKSYIRCLVGPKQSIWVMLMFFYIAVGVLAFFGGLYGLAKWNLGKESVFIWAVPVAILLYGVIYLTSKYGQRKGRDQVLYLVSFLYHSINDNEIERL